MRIRNGSPKEPGAADLLRRSHALMQELFPPDENFTLDTDALLAPDIVFLVAEDDGVVLGCGALALRPEYGEVKSMFVAEAARGRGLAAELLAALETQARARGLPWLRLETGEALAAAVRLYRRAGFAPCGPFGDYTANASSVFYEKRLAG